jgi:TRAP-type uncharacterized transport system substrate-binding protein
MKRLLLAIVLALLPLHAFAEITIGVGREGGGYYNRGVQIAERLGNRGVEASVQSFTGSNSITLAVCNNQVQMGITQIDAIYARATEGCQLQPIADYNLAGEMAFLLVPPNSRIRKLSDLNASHTVAADGLDSGTELFARTIIAIEREQRRPGDWSNIQLSNVPVESLNAQANFGGIDAAFLVRNENSADIRNLLSLGWTFAELYDRDISDREFNGRPLYESERFDFRHEGTRYRDYGYRIRSFVVVNQPTARDTERLQALQMAAQP